MKYDIKFSPISLKSPPPTKCFNDGGGLRVSEKLNSHFGRTN
jgi:hypothetical protein